MSEIDQIRLNFDARGLAALNAVLALIMFGIALDLRIADFRRILAAPRAAAAGLASQFVLLPAATFALTLLLDPPPSVALGMILVAACPGGNMSNYLTHLAGGNTALSVAMTAVSTGAALVMTPLNTALWGTLNPRTAPLLRAVALDGREMAATALLVLVLPLALGLLAARLLPGAASRLRRPLRVLSLVLFVAFLAAALERNAVHVARFLGGLAGIVALHNAAAIALGWTAGRALALPEGDVRALAIEVGIQNSGLGLLLIFAFFDGLGGMAAIAAWWGVWHMVAGLSLALFWSRRPAAEPAAPAAAPTPAAPTPAPARALAEVARG